MEIKNKKSRSSLRYLCMAFGRKITVNGLPYARRVYMTRFCVFLRTTLRHVEGDKN